MANYLVGKNSINGINFVVEAVIPDLDHDLTRFSQVFLRLCAIVI